MQDDNDFNVEPETTTRKRWKDMTVDERREYDAARKRSKREQERNEKEAQAASDNSQTLDAFWKAQRSLVSASTLAPLLKRQEVVLDNLWWLTHWLDGSYNDPASPHYVDPSDDQCYVGFEEGASDLISDYQEHGNCQTDISCLEFWKQPELLQRLLSCNDATSAFARYGLVVAIPEHHYNKFQKYLKQKIMLEKFGMHVPEYVYVGKEVLSPNHDGRGYPTENGYRARRLETELVAALPQGKEA